MEYQKIANLLDDASNQPSKFKTKNWVEVNGESRGIYNVSSQIKFKTTMLKSNLCDYSDAYILVKAGCQVYHFFSFFSFFCLTRHFFSFF